MHLLVVDDEVDIRDLIARWLRADGHHVIVADSAASALAAVDEYGMPQAAVLDVNMPDVDGIELLQLLRDRDPELPALFATAVWDSGVLERSGVAAGRHLPKPFTRAQLCAAVHDLTTSAQ
ncbi:response regulator receiver domain-containing protein [Krasilnikovia cinnamomea]|uniref:Response regulator receiver domain-containing protein n=1 Tax=Krasilnikovia cinnamomea TaxID=349313 RepID=A0A4Q7ZR32_9ACTN|nr:response regulator [Krasilnikovia cinnamomea]RZU53587.1 response regulator receiver domain-containing protein [Krasilnikovia cinnamomea]